MPDLATLIIDCGLPPAFAPAAPAQAPAQPPPPPAQAAPPGPCDLVVGTALAKGLAMPGSVDWCNQAEDVGRALADLFARVTGWIVGQNPTSDAFDQLKIAEPEGKLLAPVAAIFHLWNEAIDAVKDSVGVVVDKFRAVLREGIDLVRCLAGRCNAPAYLGAWSLWQTVRIFRAVDLGWELGPRITFQVELDFPGLTEWIESLMRYYCPTEVPEAGEATEAWLRNNISKDQRDCVWRMHGLLPATYEPFALSRREILDWREAIQYERRTFPQAPDEDTILRARGFVYQADIDMAKEMYWELPGIADHLHWLTKNVFDADYVQRYQLMDGFDQRFWPVFGPDLTALGMRKQYAQWHYAAHWIQPSPQQMLEFLYRSDEIKAATGKPFTLDDYSRLLTEQDYAPLARQWFAATAYSVPAISYVKQMFYQGVINDAQLTSYHARLGYAPEDAARFADIDRITKARQRAAQTGGWTTKAASTAWVRGQLTAQDHDAIFKRLGYTPDEAAESRRVADIEIQVKIMTRAQSKALTQIATTVTQALKVGVMSQAQASKALQDVGWPREFADGYVRVQDGAAGTAVIQQGITFLRRRVMDGSVTFQDATTELNRLGLTPTAVGRYVTIWRLMMTPRRKHRSAAQIVSDLAQGHIQAPEAIVRLTNLGYDDADTRLYLADAQGKIASIRAKEQKAQQATMAARQKALAKEAAAAAKLKKQLVAAMVRDMPVSKLEKWLKTGLISRATFRSRMALYGFTKADIELRIAEQCSAKSAACTDQGTAADKAITEQQGGGVAAK